MKRISLDSLGLLYLLFALGANAGAQSPSSNDLSGVVRDAAGAPVAEATISLLNARQSVIGATQTDRQGQFSLPGIATGSYELLVTIATDSRPAALRSRFRFARPQNSMSDLESKDSAKWSPLLPTWVWSRRPDETTQQVNVINERKLFERATTVLAQAGQEEAGLQLQRTSPTIGAIFVRGLTGAKVTVFVDGVRYSTAAMRGGINTFFNLNDASNLRDIEVLRGPNSAQFGSDSIGGGIQLISHVPLYTPKSSSSTGRSTPASTAPT